MLREALDPSDDATPPESLQRMSEVLAFLELIGSWHDDVKKLPRPVALGILKLGAGVSSLVRSK